MEKQKKNDQSLLCDIYDGQIWTELPETYLKSDDSILPLCLALNVDWFQPFKHTQYSVGALYLTVLNLPRALRFKEENIILAGIIPGPKEPPLDINSSTINCRLTEIAWWHQDVCTRDVYNSTYHD